MILFPAIYIAIYLNLDFVTSITTNINFLYILPSVRRLAYFSNELAHQRLFLCSVANNRRKCKIWYTACGRARASQMADRNSIEN